MFKSKVSPSLIPIYVGNRKQIRQIFPPRYATHREEQRKVVTYFFMQRKYQRYQEDIFSQFSKFSHFSHILFRVLFSFLSCANGNKFVSVSCCFLSCLDVN